MVCIPSLVNFVVATFWLPYVEGYFNSCVGAMFPSAGLLLCDLAVVMLLFKRIHEHL